jgi:hypothetical protein
MIGGVGGVRDFPSMENRYSQKICSRHPGFAYLFEAPTPPIIPPTITVELVARQGGEGGVRDFSSMENRYSQNVCSRHRGSADVFEAPTPPISHPTITVELVDGYLSNFTGEVVIRHGGMRWSV